MSYDISFKVKVEGVDRYVEIGECCANTNRNFIGIELDENYYNIAKQRIDESIKGGANG